MNACADLRHDLGGYVLGGLEEGEHRAVQHHLESCPDCRQELAELAGLPALLALAAEAPPAPPGRLRDRVLAGAVARRVRRRWAAVAAAAALVAALVGGVAVDRLVTTPPQIAVALETVEPFRADGWALLHEEPDGVFIELELHGLERLPTGEVYEAWLYTHDENLVSLGFVHPDGAGTATATLVAEGSLQHYRSFWVTAEPDTTSSHDGPTVLRARLPSPRG